MLELLPIDTWPTARYSDRLLIEMKIKHPTATETLDTTLGDLTCQGTWLEPNKIYGLLDVLSLMEGEEPVAEGEGVAFKRLSNTTYILRIALWAVDIRGIGNRFLQLMLVAIPISDFRGHIFESEYALGHLGR